MQYIFAHYTHNHHYDDNQIQCPITLHLLWTNAKSLYILITYAHYRRTE